MQDTSFSDVLPGQVAESSSAKRPETETGQVTESNSAKQQKYKTKTKQPETGGNVQELLQEFLQPEAAAQDGGAVVVGGSQESIDLEQGTHKINLTVDRQTVLNWLSALDNRDAQWILAMWASEKIASESVPGFKQALTALNFVPQNVGSKDTDTKMTPSGVPELNQKLSNLDTTDLSMTVTTVQFSASIYFCEDSDSHMIIDVMRIGDLTSQTKVQYQTVDGTALAGKTYQMTMGTLVFEPMENEKQISVPLIQNEDWNTTLEFLVELMQEGLVNGNLGRYLWQARVKVIDNDTFPSNRYREYILAGKLDKVPKTGLFMEYFKLNWGNSVVRRGTIKMMLVDQLHNVYFLIKLYMKVWLVDGILKGEMSSGDQVSSLIAYMIALVVPFAFLHFLDYMKFSWKVGGTSRARLQRALIEKFLNYDEESRSGLNQGDIVLAMTRHSVELVHDGYMQALSCARQVGQLVMILLFQLTSPYIVGDGKQHPTLYIPLLIYPSLQLTFLMARNTVTKDVVRTEQEQQDKLVEHVDLTVANYKLIAEYNQRPYFADRLQQKLVKYNGAATAAGKVVYNNSLFAEWITVVYVAVYTFFGGMEYIDGSLSLGMLLTNISILGTMGKSTGSIYSKLLTLQRNVPSLERVVRYMNLPTDVKHRKKINRGRRAMTKEMRQEARKAVANGIPCDNLKISIHDLKFAYSVKTMDENVRSPSSPRLEKLEIEQSTLTLLIGPRGEWKSTILKILGGMVLPPMDRDSELGFFVPSHLRVLHVSQDPMFFCGTLMDNMVFGVKPGDPDRDEHRVEKVCKILGLPDEVLRNLFTKQVLDWGAVLSQTQRQLLSIARALISNPEVLLLHKPAMIFDDEKSRHIFHTLKDFVLEKGLCQDASSRHLRRPRTCIITSNKIIAEKVADKTYHVSNAGIKLIPKGQLKKLATQQSLMPN